MRRIVEVYTCDMCKKKVEAWNDSANVCKKCARTLTFIPEVLL